MFDPDYFPYMTQHRLVNITYLQTMQNDNIDLHYPNYALRRLCVGVITKETPNVLHVDVYGRAAKQQGTTYTYYGPYSHQVIIIPKRLIESVVVYAGDVLLDRPDDVDEAE